MSLLASRQQNDKELLDAYSNAVIDVVEKVGPSVVKIQTSGKVSNTPRYENQGMGSGFIITPDGYILTNNHVIERAEKITVTLTTGEIYTSQLIGRDPATDLALIRILDTGLPYAELGNSKLIKVGQLVIAIGNPLGFQSTVSTGVISAVGRSMQSTDGRLIEQILQSDVSLNPGNSGGPLVDSRGKVLGVTTAIIKNASGIGFAVPSNTASWVISELITYGRVRRGLLGITATTSAIPPNVQRILKLPLPTMVEVISVQKNSPADKRGLQKGDRIFEVNHIHISDSNELHKIIGQNPSGTEFEICFFRNTTIKKTKIVSEEMQ